MTININLQLEIERGLLARAQAKGVSLNDFPHEVLAREAGAEPPPPKPVSDVGSLYELFAPVRGLLADEQIDQYLSRPLLPADPLIVNAQASG